MTGVNDFMRSPLSTCTLVYCRYMMGQFGDKLLSYRRDIPKINRPLPLSHIIKIDLPGCECSVDDTGARVSEIIIVRLVKLN